MTDSTPQLLPGAQPRFHRGNGIGCLVVHGFMASPAEVGWLGDHLAQEAGYTVYVPRLPGHGMDARHMRRMRWQDWLGQVLDGYQLLAQQCDKVYIAGHSMGGLLALMLAAQQPQALGGVIVAASPIVPPAPIMRWTRWLSLVRPYSYHPSEDDLNATILAEQDARDEETVGRVHYARWSSRAVYELYLLIGETEQILPQVTAPLLLLYAEQDITAAAHNAERIAQSVSSEQVETVLIDEGAHIMFQDVGREVAFDAVAAFIAKTHA